MIGLVQDSASLILKYQSPTGAYPASPFFKNYNYCWFRDGSFIADAMSIAGMVESAEKFFDWCSSIIIERKDMIRNGLQLDARYTLQGKEGSEEWGNFQLDGYGLWAWALMEHSSRHSVSISKYEEAVELTVAYLLANWRKPCHDWWEEREGSFSATLACIYAGLSAIGHQDSEMVKAAIELEKERLDGSLLACNILGATENDAFQSTLEMIEKSLVSPSGGVYRHLDDTYYGGGEWVLLTAMLGICYVRQGRQKEAQQKLDWIIGCRNNEGFLPEQVQDNMLHPAYYKKWVERWGKPANPLLWSHAMTIKLVHELSIEI